MLMLDRRLQILLDEGRYLRLAARARERKTSIATIVREAIDQALPADLEKKRAAWEELKKAEPIPLPETFEELKRELEEIRAGSHS
jgi:hypothetical protein